MSHIKLSIDMDKKCAECGNGGATGCGLCLKCCSNAMNPKAAMKTPHGLAMQARYIEMIGKQLGDQGK